MTTLPSPEVWLIVGYALVLLGVAWILDHLGERSALRSASWRTNNFVYHPDHDAWKCHQDQWLWPASFDPDKRVIRYVGQHAICGRCPVKDVCSPTPGPREITRPLDPWPHSEAGRFHRGLALTVGCIGVFLPAMSLFGARGWLEVLVLAATVIIVAALTYPLARHLWTSPANAPQMLPHDEQLTEGVTTPALAVPVDPLIEAYASRWASDRKRF